MHQRDAEPLTNCCSGTHRRRNDVGVIKAWELIRQMGVEFQARIFAACRLSRPHTEELRV